MTREERLLEDFCDFHKEWRQFLSEFRQVDEECDILVIQTGELQRDMSELQRGIAEVGQNIHILKERTRQLSLRDK